ALEIAAGEVLHDDERSLRRGIRPGVENLNDVLRIDGARSPRFPLEPRDQVVTERAIAGDDLQSDATARAGVLRLEDGPHPPLAEHPEDTVLAVDQLTDHARDDEDRRNVWGPQARVWVGYPCSWRKLRIASYAPRGRARDGLPSQPLEAFALSAKGPF